LGSLALFVGGVLTVLAGLVLNTYLHPQPPPLTVEQVNAAVAQALTVVTPPPSNAAEVYQHILPTLVLIQTEHTLDSSATADLGTGVVISADGSIVTALHVVTQALTINLTFADGTTATADLLSVAPEHDTAILRPSRVPAGLLPAPLGDPASVAIGDDAYVVGNPFGLYGSLSSGVISALSRSFTPAPNAPPIDGLFQIDAAVNDGSAGGPLLNRSGEVVGIVVGLVNPTASEVFVGIGFAVPIDDALEPIITPEF
jgi:S1-C subfamily serine protease